MNYFIGKNGQQLGPFTEEQIRSMAQGGLCHPTDLCWHEGRPNWVPLAELFGFPPSHTPPPVSSAIPAEQPSKVIKVEHYLHWGAIGYIASVVYSIRLLLTNNPDYISPWAVTASILPIIYTSIFHWKCWSAVPETFRATSPGKAIGYLFIPFFNFYWAFITWPKLAEGVETWRKNVGLDTPGELKVLGIVQASLWVSSFVAAFLLPAGVSILVDGAGLVFFCLFYIKVCAAINEAASARPSQD